MKIVRCSPLPSITESEKYYTARDTFNHTQEPSLVTKSFKSPSIHTFTTPPAAMNFAKIERPATLDGTVHKRRVQFTLPLDSPVARKILDNVPRVGGPGSTPMSENPKLAALKGNYSDLY